MDILIKYNYMFKYIWSKTLKKIRLSSILNSEIHPTSKVESGCNILNMIMGRYSFCGYDCEIINTEIGSFCSIASNVVIGGGMHPIDWVSTSPVFYVGRDSIKMKFSKHKRKEVKKTIIEHDVWIGQGVFIKQGVKIGTGSVIGMGSVVTKDVLPYSVVGGVPARVIKKRFDDEVISSLLKSKWWEFSNEQLKFYAKWIKDPSTFIDKIKNS